MIEIVSSPYIVIREVLWAKQRAALSIVRREVFINEQSVPEQLEWDDLDNCSRHLLAKDESANLESPMPIGTGRLTPAGQLGRMAIHKDYRRQGIGRKILKNLIEIALTEGHKKIYLHAQLYVVDFYKQEKFVTKGEIFLDAGIEHIAMVKTL